MNFVHGLRPVIDDRAEVLVLGSMPGVKSLAAQQYYAHPQNAFWKIMGELVGAGPAEPYADRLHRLADRHIALWDVLELCTTDGSLDSAIVESSIVANDFGALFRRYPRIKRVFFNGAKAEQSYLRHVARQLDTPGLTFSRLPSTSPAHASMSPAVKLAAWRAIVTPS